MKLYNKKIKFIVSCLIIIILINLMFFANKIEAASFRVTASKSTVTVGDLFTVTIDGTGLTGKYSITGNSNVSISGDVNPWIENTKVSVTCTAKTEGTAIITVTPVTVADSTTGIDQELSPKSVNVTIKAKETPPPTTGGSTGGSTGGNTGGSTGGNTGGSTGGTTTPTPNPTPDPTPVTPNFVSASGTRYTTQEVRLRKDWSTTTGAVMVPAGTEVSLLQTSTNTVNGYVWYKVSYKGETRYVASSYLTATKPEEEKPDEQPTTPEVTKSSNTNLKALTTNIKGLTPEFDKAIKEYTLAVDADVENIVVTALAEDEKSKVEVTGNEGLKVGENLIKVTVTAEDGTTTIYEIKVTKTEKTGLKLSRLEIEGYTLSPEFDPNIFEYTLRVSEIDKLNIEAFANDEKATVEIIGNNELVDGENLLTIIVKSEDGTETVTYTITVNKGPLETVQYADDDNMDKIITIAIIVLGVLIALIIIILIVRKMRNQDIEEDEEDTFFEGTKEYQERINPFIEDRNNDNTYEIKTKNKKGKHF